MSGPRRARGSLDVYLQPAVVGGGLGDIEEVLAVGRRIERLGWRPFLYRRPGRPLPPMVAGPWGWPSVRRVHRIVPQHLHALTVSPWWGVSANPELGGSAPAGPWSPETIDIERAYGRDHVVHLSLEEFARTLTSRQQTRERWREGGVATRAIARRLATPAGIRDVVTFHDAYRKWRAFDRLNVLHLFAGFRRSVAFAREFPEAVQSGPLWPETHSPGRVRRSRRRWVWYASPSTSDRLARKLSIALSSPGPGEAPVEVDVRSPRPFHPPPAPGVRWRRLRPMSSGEWSRRFRRAELRIATGSRTLLEALLAGGPFLYFNGVLNTGPRTRRHRPEKIDQLLDLWRCQGVAPSLRRDLSDFSRLRRVSPIVRRAVRDPRWSAQFPSRTAAADYPPAWAHAGRLLDRWVAEWARSAAPSSDFVARVRASGRVRPSTA
jgi:hypothetical protein